MDIINPFSPEEVAKIPTEAKQTDLQKWLSLAKRGTQKTEYDKLRMINRGTKKAKNNDFIHIEGTK